MPNDGSAEASGGDAWPSRGVAAPGPEGASCADTWGSDKRRSAAWGEEGQSGEAAR